MYNNVLPSIQKSTDQIFIQMVENISRKNIMVLGNRQKFFCLDQIFPDLLLLAGTCADKIHLHSKSSG